MTDFNQPAAIKFSLNETVWFRKGEEIADLYNLSLEPNVTIQDLHHFISIRGSLKMYGEYKKTEEVERNEVDENINFSGQKYVTVLEAREEGISEFHYDFPVDITIPKEKVSNLDDLNVVIEFFDYSIPDKDCLRLSTNISITGISSDAVKYERNELFLKNEEDHSALNLNPYFYEERLKPALNDTDSDSNDENSFSAQAKKVEERKEELEKNIQIPIQFVSIEDDYNIDQSRAEESLQQAIENIEAGQLTDFEREEAISENVDGKSEITSVTEHDVKAGEVKSDVSTEEEETVVRADSKQLQNQSEEAISEQIEEGTSVLAERNDESVPEANQEVQTEDELTNQEANNVKDEEENDIDALRDENFVEEAEQREDKERRTEKNIHYQPQETHGDESISLTKFFGRKDEKQAVKLKIYIVQARDTLNLIAEKYDVSVSQLLRTNQLEPHHDVYEGQILYIPTNSHKSHSL